MLENGTKVKINLPEYVQIPTSNTGLVMKTVKNESPYQGQNAIIIGKDYETEKRFNEGEAWYVVKFESMATVPDFARKTMPSFPEHCLILL